MKHIKNLIIGIAVIMTLGGCEEKLNPSASEKHEIKGMVFEYSLLNAQMEATDHFKEGENFFLKFSVKNKTGKDYYFYPQYVNDNDNDFLVVYSKNGQKIGKPYFFNFVQLIGMAGFSFNQNDEYVFVQPWVDSRDSMWSWNHGHYSSTHQKPLPVGEYQTSFTETFRFEGPGSSEDLVIEDVKFKVYFKIKN